MGKIHVKNDYEGEWHQLLLDDVVFAEGHEISKNDWINLLLKLGFEVTEEECSLE
jgi:hypothetical protein